MSKLHARLCVLVLATSACGAAQPDPEDIVASARALSSPPEVATAAAQTADSPQPSAAAIPAAPTAQPVVSVAAADDISKEDPSELPPEARRAFLMADRAARREALAIKRGLLSQTENKRSGLPASPDRDQLDKQIRDMRDNIARAEARLRVLDNMP